MSDLRVIFEGLDARVRLDRPHRRKAMSKTMWLDLPKICAGIEICSEGEAVDLEGAGECDEAFADLESARRCRGAIEGGLNSFARLDRPTLAKSLGAPVGGGLSAALTVETCLLVEIVGPAAAKDPFFSGRSIRAVEAACIGHLNRLVQSAALDGHALNQTQGWASLSRGSIRSAKKAVRGALASKPEDLRAPLAAAAIGGDFREGRAAFAARHSPRLVRGG